jgi:hypothetical protein
MVVGHAVTIVATALVHVVHGTSGRFIVVVPTPLLARSAPIIRCFKSE